MKVDLPEIKLKIKKKKVDLLKIKIRKFDLPDSPVPSRRIL